MVFEWLSKYGIVIIFYAGMLLLIYFNRKKFHFESKIIAMYRTKFGLKLMDKIGSKHPKIIKFLGIIGIYVGFLGMLAMLYMVVYGLYLLVFDPTAPPLFSPVLPGITIPGSPITVPLVEGLLALFIVIVVHEFSHGVMARAYGLPIKSSGFVMIGPLPGAFVEPDEKKLKKSSQKAQMSIFAAGPFSNVLLTFLIFGITLLIVNVTLDLYQPAGIEVEGFVNADDGLPGGRLSSFEDGEIITSVNGVSTNYVFNLSDALNQSKPGDSVEFQTNLGTKILVLTSDPDNESRPYIGIFLNHYMESSNNIAAVIKGPYLWLFGNPYDLDFNARLGLLGWVFVLSLGIGLVNLLPLGPVDGGRMYLLVLQKLFKKKAAMSIWTNTAKLLLLAIIILIFVPIIKAVFGL